MPASAAALNDTDVLEELEEEENIEP